MVKISFDTAPAPKAEEANLILSESAARRVAQIIASKENNSGMALRLSVMGGGCSGYSYKFELTKNKKDSDRIFTNPSVNSVELWVDAESLSFLEGSTIDFEETLEASQFVVNNPNAASSCGCGTSFAYKG